ncbi:MAG: anti-sigma factor [Stellaceae bacterium]
MIPKDRDALHVLSGEYVLGVLGPEAAREVEVALASNPELRRAVAFWEERFHGLTALVPPSDPPADVWDRIAARLGAAVVQSATARLWNSIRLWRWSAAAAMAAAAALALYIALAPPVAGPSLVAILHAPQQAQPAWVATAGGNGLRVRAVSGSAAPGGRSFELWPSHRGRPGPNPLALSPPTAGSRWTFCPRSFVMAALSPSASSPGAAPRRANRPVPSFSRARSSPRSSRSKLKSRFDGKSRLPRGVGYPPVLTGAEAAGDEMRVAV